MRLICKYLLPFASIFLQAYKHMIPNLLQNCTKIYCRGFNQWWSLLTSVLLFSYACILAFRSLSLGGCSLVLSVKDMLLYLCCEWAHYYLVNTETLRKSLFLNKKNKTQKIYSRLATNLHVIYNFFLLNILNINYSFTNGQ